LTWTHFSLARGAVFPASPSTQYLLFMVDPRVFSSVPVCLPGRRETCQLLFRAPIFCLPQSASPLPRHPFSACLQINAFPGTPLGVFFLDVKTHFALLFLFKGIAALPHLYSCSFFSSTVFPLFVVQGDLRKPSVRGFLSRGDKGPCRLLWKNLKPSAYLQGLRWPALLDSCNDFKSSFHHYPPFLFFVCFSFFACRSQFSLTIASAWVAVGPRRRFWFPPFLRSFPFLRVSDSFFPTPPPRPTRDSPLFRRP